MNRPIRNQRRIHYVDYRIQMRLLVALVVLEIALIAFGLMALYHGFNTAIEQDLFRVHVTATERTLPVLLRTALPILLVLGALNVAGLVIADRIWTRYVGSVLSAFRAIVQHIGRLDFTGPGAARRHHEVLELAQRWHDAERATWTEVRRIVHTLDPDAIAAQPGQRARLEQALGELERLVHREERSAGTSG